MGISADIVIAAMMWIANNTAYIDAHRIAPPEIETVSREQLASLCRIDGCNQRAETIHALYSCRQRRVYLGDHLDQSTAFGRAALVHELTRHVQCVKGVNQADYCARSTEAWTANGKFYQQHTKTRPELWAEYRLRVEAGIAAACGRT